MPLAWRTLCNWRKRVEDLEVGGLKAILGIISMQTWKEAGPDWLLLNPSRQRIFSWYFGAPGKCHSPQDSANKNTTLFNRLSHHHLQTTSQLDMGNDHCNLQLAKQLQRSQYRTHTAESCHPSLPLTLPDPIASDWQAKQSKHGASEASEVSKGRSGDGQGRSGRLGPEHAVHKHLPHHLPGLAVVVLHAVVGETLREESGLRK